MIAILSALEEEVREFRKGMSIRKTSDHADCRVFEGVCHDRSSLLVLTGMGQKRAVKAATLVLEKYPVKTLISSGFGGALNEKTRVGDIVIYSKMGHEGQEVAGKQDSLRGNLGLILTASRLLNRGDFRIVVGNGVTVFAVCCTPDSKFKLGRVFSADVVDMESYWIGQTAAERKIPFLAVRSIFDTVQDDVTLLNRIIASGKVKPLKALNEFITHPGQIRQMTNYTANFRKAGKNLGLFLDNLIQQI